MTLATASSCAYSQALLTDGIRAVVNDDVITALQVDEAADETVKVLQSNFQGAELDGRIRDAKLNALKLLIERDLILADFKKMGGNIPELFINQRIAETIRDEPYNGDRVAFIKTLEARGITMQKYRQDIADSAVVFYMKDRQVGQNTLVSPYQIEKYYQDHLKQYTTDEQMDVSKIVLHKSTTLSTRPGPDGKDQQYDPQKELAEQIVAQLYSGAKFEDLAHQYSESDDKDAGGEMGLKTKVGVNAIREDLWTALEKLQPGQFTDVLEDQDSYIILRLNDRKLPGIAKLDDVRAEIEAAVHNDEAEQRYEEWLDGLRSKAYIKIF